MTDNPRPSASDSKPNRFTRASVVDVTLLRDQGPATGLYREPHPEADFKRLA